MGARSLPLSGSVGAEGSRQRQTEASRRRLTPAFEVLTDELPSPYGAPWFQDVSP